MSIKEILPTNIENLEEKSQNRPYINDPTKIIVFPSALQCTIMKCYQWTMYPMPTWIKYTNKTKTINSFNSINPYCPLLSVENSGDTDYYEQIQKKKIEIQTIQPSFLHTPIKN
jgi:hypothetical protein